VACIADCFVEKFSKKTNILQCVPKTDERWMTRRVKQKQQQKKQQGITKGNGEDVRTGFSEQQRSGKNTLAGGNHGCHLATPFLEQPRGV
jgi:hypothetical protein